MNERLRPRPRPRTQPDETLTVDYADVLRQAVANQRWLILRELTRTVRQIDTSYREGGSYSRTDLTATQVKEAVLQQLAKMEGVDR